MYKQNISVYDNVRQKSYSITVGFANDNVIVDDEECILFVNDFDMNRQKSLIECEPFMRSVQNFNNDLYHILRLKHYNQPSIIFASPLSGPSSWVQHMVWDLLLDDTISQQLSRVTEKYLLTPICYEGECLYIDMYGHYFGIYDMNKKQMSDLIRLSNECRKFTVQHHDKIDATNIYTSCIQALLEGEPFEEVSNFFTSFAGVFDDAEYTKSRLDNEININI